ncbi:trypsin-like serine protease [Catellatospora bangladeshensis]|uniref:trypsin-like serine protease n=1 Tax=Catellatospora bangladeshensis TaxID=310355 RepID=UPI00361C1895
MSSRLGHLAQDSLVQLRRSRAEFAGVGFVIAPELVVTNAHVATDDIQVWAGGRQYACSSVRRYPDQGAQHPEWPFPDLAELVVPGLQAPPVLLGALTEQTHPPDEVLVPTFHIPSVQDSLTSLLCCTNGSACIPPADAGAWTAASCGA